MPNLRGPDETKRRLYAHVIHSVLLYAAPVWAEKFAESKTQQIPIKRIQRGVAIRVIRGYKTISYEAATLLAKMPPLFLLAARQRRVYVRMKELKESEEEITAKARDEVKNMADLLMQRQWAIYMSNPTSPGLRVRNAILSIFNEWLTRRHGDLTFHLTQILTGHGSFGLFLFRICKVDSALCPYCKKDEDTPQHTLEICPRWEVWRINLKRIVGNDLEFGILLKVMTRDSTKWKAAVEFARGVMAEKEKEEWKRQRAKRNAELFGVTEEDDST